MRHSTKLSTDDLLRHEALGATSTYRVIELLDDQLVSVEVLASPGLRAGTRLRITRQAAQAMACERARAGRSARRALRPRAVGVHLHLAP